MIFYFFIEVSDVRTISILFPVPLDILYAGFFILIPFFEKFFYLFLLDRVSSILYVISMSVLLCYFWVVLIGYTLLYVANGVIIPLFLFLLGSG